MNRKVVNFRDAEYVTYSLQGKPQEDISWHNSFILRLASNSLVFASCLPAGSIENPGMSVGIFAGVGGRLRIFLSAMARSTSLGFSPS